MCYYYSNDPDRALQQFEASLKVNPTHAKTLLNQGIVLAFGKQDLKGAAAAWEKLIQMAPTSPEAETARKALQGLKSAHPETDRQVDGLRGRPFHGIPASLRPDPAARDAHPSGAREGCWPA